MNTAINSLSEYVSEICQLSSKLVCNGVGKNETLLYRGQSNSTYDIVPSVGRLVYGDEKDKSILGEERNLIEMAKYKMPDVFRNDLQPIELLALLQHHGIPTRLLDITENALVALFFACNKDNKIDGEVIVFKNNELDIANYPIINAIAESYKYAFGSFTPLDLFYGDIVNQPYFLEQKQSNDICHQTKEEGGRWVEQCCKSPMFIYAPVRSIRQQIQQGRYILFANKMEDYGNSGLKCFGDHIDPISKDHPCIIKRIQIPSEIKHKLLNELKLFGICEERLFSDNIDVVCKEIVKQFSRKPRGNVYCFEKE